MASIPASQLVEIQPGVIGSSGSPLSLNSIFLTNSTAPPIGSLVSFANVDEVIAYFGPTSIEATTAAVYFLGFTGATQVPGALYIAQYAAAAVAAYSRGVASALTLAALQAIIPGVTTASVGSSCTGSIATTVLTVASAVTGVFRVGDVLTGTGVAAGTAIVSLGTGTGGVGTYNLNNSQTTTSTTITGANSILNVTAVASGALSAGQLLTGSGVTASTRITSQLTGTAGSTGTYQLDTAQTVASGTLTGSVDMSVSIDGSAKSFTTLNLAAATSQSSAATLIGTALSLSGGQTCTFDSTFSAFVIKSGTTGATSTIALATGAAATLFGLGTGATLSQGAAADTPSGAMTALTALSQNWASFMTMFEPSLANKKLFAIWCNAQNQKYLYAAWDTDTNAIVANETTNFGAVVKAAAYDGTIVLYNDIQHAALVCAITGSIDFAQRDGRITYAFKSQSGLTVSVTNATVAQTLIDNGYNFYGSYSTATQQFSFLQPGQISGKWKWVDSYVNQIYFNADLQLAGMTLMANARSLPYNDEGYQAVRDTFSTPIQAALNFGTIRAGVALSSAQASQANMAAGVKIDQTLTQVGYYLQVLPAGSTARADRDTPPCNLWYMDGGSIQKLNLGSTAVI
jgi:uncharacterized protein DUF3383